MKSHTAQIHTPPPSAESEVRPPVVVVMGHVDHGKSTLLDFIRKSNVVAGESGGITQHIQAYEVTHTDDEKKNRRITFLDTPGHEAFSKMRERGVLAADIAILIVSAEDGVKAQTLEAYQAILHSNIPYIVAINKIDRPGSNVEKVKMDLVEKGIYLEGLGGDIPFVPISAKVGTGINELLDMIILVSDLHAFTGNPDTPAVGVIVESNREPKRGISASCIIKNGTLTSGMTVVAGKAMVTTRILENFLGEKITTATFSSPIRLVGFESMPEVGSPFISFASKKEAEKYLETVSTENSILKKNVGSHILSGKRIPLVVKSDVSGTIEAIEKEIEKLNSDDISFYIISTGVGAINESDLKMARDNKESIIIGFNTKIDGGARDLNEQLKITIETFTVIYKLIDWLKEIRDVRRPRQETVEVTGTLKILKTFGATKERQVVGGKVMTGRITDGGSIRIMRREFEIGQGKIVGLQLAKIKTKEVLEGTDCGLQVESKITIAPGDILEAFITIIK